MEKPIAHIISDAALILQQRGWARGAQARDRQQRPVAWSDRSARTFSLEGAIRRAAVKWMEPDEAVARVEALLGCPPGGLDRLRPRRRKPQVLHHLHRALFRARMQGGLDGTTRAVLSRARDLVARGWARGAPADTADGRPVDALDPAAESFCLRGAIARAAYEVGVDPGPAIAAVARYIRWAPTGVPPVGMDEDILEIFNDGRYRPLTWLRSRPRPRQEDILAALEAVIEDSQ
jgi:hypothetical protein